MSELSELFLNQIKDLKTYFIIYLVYCLLAITGSIVVFYLLLKLLKFFNLEIGEFYLTYITETKNIESILYVIGIFIVTMASISYIALCYINKIDSLKRQQIENLLKLSERMEDLNKDVKLHLNYGDLNIINYQELINKERDFECKEIYIITNDLKDDINDEHFFKIILDNLIKKKKYKFIVPNISSNKTDGCTLLGNLLMKLKEGKYDFALKNPIGNYCEVYLILDIVFRMCAFRDIAIYGASYYDKKKMGYAELPYIDKSADPNNRFFIEIDNRVCLQMVNDINEIIKKSDYVEALSCNL